MKKSVAVIGSGIAGMGAAYYLRKEFDVHLYERNNYIGGHTNTVNLRRDGKNLPIDSGFMVFNDKTYPNLIRLFDELGVDSYDTSMSFGVQNVETGLEFACSGFSSFFAQRLNLAKLPHWKLYKEIIQYFESADTALERPSDPSWTLEEFVGEFGLSPGVVEDFIAPMASAIWSTPNTKIMDFPAQTLLRFLKNHQMLGVGIQLQWKTVKGGSQTYRDSLLSKLTRPPLSSYGVESVAPSFDGGAQLTFNNGEQKRFDYAVIATHADQALALLSDPSELQAKVLCHFHYNTNPVVLHSDSSVMPRSKRAWASWNFRHSGSSTGNPRSSTHYWMNNLQNVDHADDYFVSVDYEGSINPAKVHWSATYEHPRYDAAAISAQAKLPKLNQEGSIFFCGSYFRYGFHEDALASAIDAANALKERNGIRHELVSL
ncbi:MAG: FAD-dependent oxidoreductase [Verrucomicrobiota bacterium]